MDVTVDAFDSGDLLMTGWDLMHMTEDGDPLIIVRCDACPHEHMIKFKRGGKIVREPDGSLTVTSVDWFGPTAPGPPEPVYMDDERDSTDE